jgi:hypothetical protein
MRGRDDDRCRGRRDGVRQNADLAIDIGLGVCTQLDNVDAELLPGPARVGQHYLPVERRLILNDDRNHLVQLSTGNLHFPSVNFQSKDALIRAASINVVIAFSATTLVLDQAFDTIGMKPDYRATGANGKLRLLVYMIRCAYAHGFTNPRWHVTNKKAGVVTVNFEGQRITLDLPRLHGQVFNIEQIGGYENWYRIHNAARRLFSGCEA